MEVTAGWILDNDYWERYCELTGTNVWALNEGLMKETDWVDDFPEELLREHLGLPRRTA